MRGIVVFVFAVCLACGPRGIHGTIGDTDAEQLDGGCPIQPSVLVGHAASGASCSTSRECWPTCCLCPRDSKRPDSEWLAALCNDGRCVGGTAACDATASSSLCE